ncbi:MAG: HlyC/CorC family transporter [Lachnospiraceae bacterium]|nr:HlyC/CorC family transporter [Lachnospiraceae bacterium]
MILLQIVLILLNAVFACAEIAVISMNDNKLAKMASEGDKRAIRLEKLVEQPARFLATIQVAITLSGFLGSAFAAENFSGVIVDWLVGLGVPIPVKVLDSVAVIFITIVLSYFTLVFGELLPKQIAMRKAEVLALGLSGLISGIAKVFAPLVSLLTLSTNGILRLFGIDPDAEDDEVSEEEIRMMVDVGSEKGTIDFAEKEFIQNVFEFDDLSAEEIITHRTEVVMLDLEDSMDIWKETIYDSRHTLYPVCEGTADKVVGILNSKDYFRLEDRSRESVMEKAVRPAYFVPGTVKADTLFKNMKREHHVLAVVMDEYGGMSGIITINDLVEQLVGDLGDETVGTEAAPIEKVGENTWKIQGTASLEDISEELGISLSCEEYDTFSGFVLHELGSIPEEGAVIETEISDLHISAAGIKNHQVETAVVRLLQVEKADD